mgnify:CR=1 FL=1
MKYAILIYDTNSANPSAEPPPPEVIKQVMDEYNAYTEMLRSSSAFQAGDELVPERQAVAQEVLPLVRSSEPS